MPRPKIALLSPERIADAALELIGADGQFTIPALARKLGVQPSSLYNHVGGRDDIVELVRSRIHDTMGPKIDPAMSWQEAVRHVARSDRASLGQYPWTIPSIMHFTMQPGTPLDSVVDLAEVLSGAGFRDDELLPIIGAIDLLDMGSAFEMGWAEPEYTPDQLAEAGLLAPVLVSLPAEQRSERSFEWALDLFIRSLERRLAQRGGQHASPE